MSADSDQSLVEDIIDIEMVDPERDDIKPLEDDDKNRIASLYNVIYQTTVPEDKKEYFEKSWLPHIYELLLSWNGFHHRSVHLLKIKNGVAEYVVLLAFQSYESFRNWNISPLRKNCISKLSVNGISSTRLDLYGGDDNDNLSIDSSLARVNLHDSLAFIPRPYPPAKWKLTIIIFVGVCIGNLLISYSGLPLLMIITGLPEGFRIFCTLCITVPVLSYCLFPVIMTAPLVASWLRSPRSCSIEDMSPIHALLVQGLLMFSAKMTPVLPRDFQEHMAKIEGKLVGLRRANFRLTNEVNTLRHRLNAIDGDGSVQLSRAPSLDGSLENKLVTFGTPEHHLQSSLEQKAGEFMDVVGTKLQSRLDRTDPQNFVDDGAAEEEHSNDAASHMPLTMAVTNWVKWECVLEFEQWSKRMAREMSRHEGFLGLTTILPKTDKDPYVNSFTFDSLPHMMSFIDSQERKRIIRDLAPLLEGSTAAELNEERVIENAFTELFVSTGDFAEIRPPPVWKSVVLTVIPLHLIVWQVGFNITPLIIEGFSLQLIYAQIISTAITTIINNYVGVPMMQAHFGEWLRADRKIKSGDIFMFLDTGIPSHTVQILIFLLFSAAAIICGAFHLLA